MSLIIRVDDFPGTKPDEFTRHNLENFKKFDAVLEKVGVKKYILGFIPKHCTEEDLMWLCQNPRIILAIHGIEHDESRRNDLEHKSENEIVRDLQMIRSTMKNSFAKDVDIYMPPHNVFDLKTLKALSRAGFKAITGGPESDSILQTEKYGIQYLYSKFPYEYGRSDELSQRGSVEYISNQIQAGRQSVLCLHWTWEYNIGLDSLERYLSRLSPYFTVE